MKIHYLGKTFPLVLLGAAPLLHGQSVVLFDDMSDTFYSDFSFNGADSGSNPDDVSTATWANNPTEGNPGAVFSLSHDHDVNRDEFGDPLSFPVAEIQSFFDNNSNITYNPGTQGAISTLSFSLDIKTSDPFGSIFFVVSDSMGGSVARGAGGAGFLSIIPNGEWQTVTLSGVTQAEVGGRDLSGALPLDFGFGFTSLAEVSGGPETYFLQADNFSVTINPVPEPSSALLLAVGLIGFVRRR